MRNKSTRSYRPKGWSHYLDRDPREQSDALKGDDGLAGPDATTLFLRDLRKHGVPLLTSDQEVGLARRTHAGDERALEQLVSANLRLCAHLAKRSKSKGRGQGLEFGDLVSAGVTGLREAIKHFDPERGVRLASFAYIYVLGAIRDEIERAQTIRLPREVASLSQRIIKAKEHLRANDYRLTSKGGRVWRGWEPTTEEIASYLDISPEKVADTLRHPSQRIQPSSGASGPKAGEMGLGTADGDGFGTEDDEVTSAEQEVETDETNARLYDGLYQLTKQEREVVSRFFDLVQNPDVPLPNAHGGESLTKIARTMGISKQHASKVQREALRKLRKALDDLAQ